MYRSLKMRIEPNSEQRRIIEGSFRMHCYVYNGLITACKLYHDKNGKLSIDYNMDVVDGIAFAHWIPERYKLAVYKNK